MYDSEAVQREIQTATPILSTSSDECGALTKPLSGRFLTSAIRKCNIGNAIDYISLKPDFIPSDISENSRLSNSIESIIIVFKTESILEH